MIVFAFLALLGFVVSLAVHASTFAADPPIGMNRAWPLHIGIFLVFLPMAMTQRPARPASANDDAKAKSPSWNEQFPHAPRWMLALGTAFFAYALLNFVLFLVMGDGSPKGGKVTEQDGRRVLMSHGKVVRELSATEYRTHQARIARGFSGHWMIFYWMSFVGLYDGLLGRRAARAALPPFPALPAAIRHTNAYERAPTPRMSPWMHATVGSILSIVGFFAVPFTVVSLIFAAKSAGAGGGWVCLIAPLFFGGAILGLSLPGTLMARHVAAACPACGGRAYADGKPLRGKGDEPVRYTCRDCGRACGVDGSAVEPETAPTGREAKAD